MARRVRTSLNGSRPRFNGCDAGVHHAPTDPMGVIDILAGGLRRLVLKDEQRRIGVRDEVGSYASVRPAGHPREAMGADDDQIGTTVGYGFVERLRNVVRLEDARADMQLRRRQFGANLLEVLFGGAPVDGYDVFLKLHVARLYRSAMDDSSNRNDVQEQQLGAFNPREARCETKRPLTSRRAVGRDQDPPIHRFLTLFLSRCGCGSGE